MVLFDARYNYWGDMFGPSGASNASHNVAERKVNGGGTSTTGVGDIVSKNVAFEPFLTCTNYVYCQNNPTVTACTSSDAYNDPTSNSCVDGAPNCPTGYYGDPSTRTCKADADCFAQFSGAGLVNDKTKLCQASPCPSPLIEAN